MKKIKLSTSFEKKNIVIEVPKVKYSIQSFNGNLEINSSKFCFLYPIIIIIIKLKVSNVVNLCCKRIYKNVVMLKSINRNFFIEKIINSGSWTLKGIQAKKIKYCVIHNEIIFPNLLFKKELLMSRGNLFDKNLGITR